MIKFAAVAAALALAALTGCAQQHTTTTIAVEPVIAKTITHLAVTPVTFAAAGDSITDWAFRPNPSLPLTWVNYATSNKVTFTQQGWAKGGAKLAEIDANTTPVTADVLVILAGTNDMAGPRWATPIAARSASLVDIVVKSHARRVLIVASPPRNIAGPLGGDPAWVAAWTAEERRLAAGNGWSFIDPWVFLRASDGQYLPGMTVEGVHPSAAAQQHLAVELRAAIIAANAK